MSVTKSFAIRPFSWPNFDVLPALIEAIRGNPYGPGPLDPDFVRMCLEQPGCYPERDCFLAWVDAQPTGYLLLTREHPIGRGVVEGGVHPHFRQRGIGRRLLQTAMEHAKSLGLAYLHVATAPDGPAADHLLRSEGFSPVRVEWHMRWEHDDLPALQVPQSYTVRSLQPGEEQRFTEIQNATFAGNWGFSPNTVDQIAYRIRLPGCSPEGVLFLTHGDAIAGYCWTRLAEAPNQPTGIILMTGVRSEYRRRGLGHAVVLAGMHHLVGQNVDGIELTVDQQNTPACRLYTLLGFRRRHESHWYERTL